MRVLVTGGAGFIGSHVVDLLVARGDEVTVIDNLSTGDRRNLNPAAGFVEVDIRSEAAAGVVRTVRPHGICHLAAHVSVPGSMRDPVHDAEVNVIGGLRLLSAAAEVGSRFVFSSSGGAVYGSPQEVPTPETVAPRPVNPYGVGKLAFEQYLAQFHAQGVIEYLALRYSNVYGPRQNAQGEAGVVAVFCTGLLGERDFVIHGTGTDTRDFVFVGDVALANVLALDGGRAGCYNIGSGVETTINALYQQVAASLESDAAPRYGPPRPGDVRRSAVDPSLALDQLGWRPAVSLAEGIRVTADWFRARMPDPLGASPGIRRHIPEPAAQPAQITDTFQNAPP